LKLFREDAGFTSDFNDAWNQSEGYLAFVVRQRQYLRDEKGLQFENPRCVLIAGFGLPEDKLTRLREKQTFAYSISIFTYDHLLETAHHIFDLARTAHDKIVPSNRAGGLDKLTRRCSCRPPRCRSDAAAERQGRWAAKTRMSSI